MIVDLIIIAIIAIAIFVGKMRGLTVTLVNVFSFIIALVVALVLCKPIGNALIENTKIDDNIKQTIKENIPMNDADFTINDNYNLPKQMKEYINNIGSSATHSKDEMIENVSTELTKEVIYIICFIVIYIAVKIALIVVKILSKFISKLPVLKEIDSIGGAICGAVEGVIIVYFVFTIISISAPILSGTPVIDQVNKSYIGKFIYNNNFIANRVIKKNIV